MMTKQIGWKIGNGMAAASIDDFGLQNTGGQENPSKGIHAAPNAAAEIKVDLIELA